MVKRLIAFVVLMAGMALAAVPSYQSVPEHWQAPIGPYHQAPAECGSRWYWVSPFNPQPWRGECSAAPPEPQPLPAGFVEVFGPRPDPNDFKSAPNPSLAFRIATDLWNQDLGYFKKAGPPEWITAAERSNAEETFRAWGMGAPRWYEGRYGFMARFRESAIKDFEAPAWSMVFATHNLVASYQMRMIEMGDIPPKRHPFVPPHLWPQTQIQPGGGLRLGEMPVP